MKMIVGASALAVLTMSVHSKDARAEEGGKTALSVIAANHAAVGNVPTTGAAHFDYTNASSGLTGDLSDRFDLATGAFVEAEDMDGIADANGYDGSTPWQRDISGANTPQQGGDRIAVAVNAAYRFANLWWRPGFGGAAVTFAGSEVTDGRAFDHLVVVPKGGKRFDAWFDAKSHLLDHIVENRQFLHVTTTYSDDRREGAAMIPHTITVDPGQGPGGLDVATLKTVSSGPARPLSSYAMPTIALVGASIENGAASTTVPFRLLNNHIYVQARVNGKGPYTFIVDTGGHTLLSPRIVSDLGLKPVGQAISSGAGDGHSTTGFVHFDEIAIGGARLRNQMGFATPIYDKSIEGIAVDGMVGFELIRRLVTQVDYERKTLTFSDPSRFRATAATGSPVPFVFYDHLPNVSGSAIGLPARFNIDTGSRAEIDFTSPFVRANNLRNHFEKGTSAVTGWGVGGPARDYMVRLSALQVGPFKIDDIAAGLSEAKGGSIADPNYEGNIGSALLKRFVVTFDYAHQIMYLKRIVPTPPDIGTFDRSGLWINADAGGYQVTDVAKGSAGSEAGVAVGDVITAIDRKPVVAENLYLIRRMFRASAPGTKIELTINRENKTRQTTIILRDQI